MSNRFTYLIQPIIKKILISNITFVKKKGYKSSSNRYILVTKSIKKISL